MDILSQRVCELNPKTWGVFKKKRGSLIRITKNGNKQPLRQFPAKNKRVFFIINTKEKIHFLLKLMLWFTTTQDLCCLICLKKEVKVYFFTIVVVVASYLG